MTLPEVAEWVKTAKKLTQEDIAKMFAENNVKNDDYKVGGHVVPDEMAKYFGAVEEDCTENVPDHVCDGEKSNKDTEGIRALA